jgi:hypothetical protein
MVAAALGLIRGCSESRIFHVSFTCTAIAHRPPFVMHSVSRDVPAQPTAHAVHLLVDT